MQVSVEVLDGLQRRLTVQVPSNDIQGEVDRRLRDLSRRVRLDGFRPGKVPMKVLKRRFGDSVLNEVTQEVIEKSFVDAVSQERLRPAGGPHIHAQPPKEGEDYSFQATFEVYPEFSVQGLESIVVKRPVAHVSDEDVDAMLERLRRQRQSWHAVERPAETGDRVVIDYKGVLEGESEPFHGGTGEDLPVVLGSGNLIPGFEDELHGVNAGAERRFSLSFPESYQVQDLAAKRAEFEVKVKAVEGAELPELDEEFARAFGIEDGDLERLRSELKASLERELEQAVRRRLKSQVMQALFEANQVDLPRVLVEQEVRALAKQSGALPTDADAMAPIPEEARERLEGSAGRRVGLGLVIAEIVRSHDLKPDTSRVEAELDRLAVSYEQPEQVKHWYRQNEQAMESLRAMVLEDQVIDWVLERCQVEDEPTTFAEVTGGDPAAEAASPGETS